MTRIHIINIWASLMALGKESTWQCRTHRRLTFDPWVRKMLWRRKWQPTSVFLSGKFHGQRSLSSVQLLNRVQFFETPWTTARQAPCPSPTPGVHPNPCPLSQWYHPTISSSVIPFSSCPQSFPASASFQMSQLFASGGQSIGVSASTSVLPMNTQDWSPVGWTDWISLQSKGLSGEA